jgi:hypothetical protein
MPANSGILLTLGRLLMIGGSVVSCAPAATALSKVSSVLQLHIDLRQEQLANQIPDRKEGLTNEKGFTRIVEDMRSIYYDNTGTERRF